MLCRWLQLGFYSFKVDALFRYGHFLGFCTFNPLSVRPVLDGSCSGGREGRREDMKGTQLEELLHQLNALSR